MASRRKKLKLIEGQGTLSFGATAPPRSEEIVEEGKRDSDGDEGPRTIDNPQHHDRPEPSPSSHESQSASKTTSQPDRTFQDKWLDIYPWLRYKNNIMYCERCRKAKNDSTLAVGCVNFRTSTLSRHVNIWHKIVDITEAPPPKGTQTIPQARVNSLDKQSEAVSVAFKALFWLCKENLPLVKFRSLMRLLTSLGVPHIEQLHCRDTVDYTSDSSADDFLQVLSDLIDDNISKKMQQSPVLTVFVDESTDIVVHHKLAINVRIVDPTTLKPSTHFLTDVRLHEGTGMAFIVI